MGNYEAEIVLPQKSKNVVIVGGGPAGLECARVASSRGHKVILLEQMKRLGGTALFSSLTTPKNGELIKWFEAVLEDSQVEIRKGFLADKKSILSLNPDAVVIATGSKSSKSDIKGSDLPHVLSRDQLRGLLQGSKSLYRHENSKTSNFLLLQIDKKLGILDSHLFHGNELGLDIHNITWRRVIDINDRSLRNTMVGLGGRLDGIPRETGFDITAASEVMAALALCTSLADLRERMGRIVVGYDKAMTPVTADDIEVAGAMTVLLKEAIKPNLMQRLFFRVGFVALLFWGRSTYELRNG